MAGEHTECSVKRKKHKTGTAYYRKLEFFMLWGVNKAVAHPTPARYKFKKRQIKDSEVEKKLSFTAPELPVVSSLI